MPYDFFSTILTVVLALITLTLTLVSATPYTYLSYADITTQLQQLAKRYPDLVRVYSAQEQFGLPFVGNCKTYAQSSNTSAASATLTKQPCHVWIVQLTEHATLVPDEMSRPEMLVSGEVHGDEVVGPQVVMAFIKYMVDSYARGDSHARLMLSTRVVTLIPTANAIGYELGIRHEIQDVVEAFNASKSELHVGIHGEHGHHAEHHVHLDPNRDFAFDNAPGHCMRTLTARIFNELMRRHMFQLLITFHGGTNVIGYEWGDTFHCQHRVCAPAPDDNIMRRLGLRMRDAADTAGRFEPKYLLGTMGKTVYEVHGGLEDWAYGASWSGQSLVCKPKELGGYPPERTKYTDAMTRSITYLVETGMVKRPAESTLGGDSNPMTPGADDDGHVPRNLRLLSVALDALEPYVLLEARDRVPFARGSDKALNLTWRVGGAFVVDGTYLQWGTKGGRDGVTEVLRGSAGPNGTLFNSGIPYNTKEVPDGTTLYVRAAAVADNSLDRKVAGASPSVLPQSHLLAARARGGWKHRLGDNVVMAKRVVYSQTLRVEAFESYLRLSVDSDVRWGAGTGRVPSPTNSAALKQLYPRANHYPLIHGPFSPFRHMSIRSWGFFALVVLLWSLPCWVFYRNRCCSKNSRDDEDDDIENKDPLLDESILS